MCSPPPLRLQATSVLTRVLALLLGCATHASCSSTAPGLYDGYGQQGTRASFDLEADLPSSAAYWDFPFPSDLRLTSDGFVDYRGFPNPRALPLVESFRQLASQTRGFSVLAVAWFRFNAPLAPRGSDALPAAKDPKE